jgi:hypothetical protein|tara:strand:+ start:1082 stop:1363 length:282 start_codon:yes stop_codon:yes gene_type:complete
MAVPSRPQHLAKPKPRRSDTGKKINLRASAKSADKNREAFQTANGHEHSVENFISQKQSCSSCPSMFRFNFSKSVFIRVICVSFSRPFASIRS